MTATLHYVAFRSHHDTPLTVASRLRVPTDGKDKHPAVILLHGSAGPSGREGGYADALNAAGFITLEPDLWAARGFAGGAVGRPSPQAALGDLSAALAFLSNHAAVDPARIGVGGFSFGGVMTLLAATRAHSAGLPLRAFMPVYPATWIWNRAPGFALSDLVDAPILLITGALDQYDNDPEVSAKLVAGLAPADAAKITLKVMADSHHGFDMPGADMEVDDPFGNQGKGGKVIMRYNPETTKVAHRLAVEFFAAALK